MKQHTPIFVAPTFELGREYVTPNGMVSDLLIYATIDKDGQRIARWVRFRSQELGTIERKHL